MTKVVYSMTRIKVIYKQLKQANPVSSIRLPFHMVVHVQNLRCLPNSKKPQCAHGKNVTKN
jgi:hypothetical protein